jgi:isoleucyl-tRNA synthetase
MTDRKPFVPLPADTPPAELEARVATFWREAGVFHKSLERTKNGQPFVFYEGPPTANGMPHHGHVLTRAIKDLFPRYRTMCGYSVERKAGWDTHGLPVEIEVEKTLGLEGKQDIERYGLQPFVDQCRESVWKYRGEWEKLTERIGFWLDMDHPYVTYDKSYVESVWWSLRRLHEKGLLYKGHKILRWCPRDMTALSTHEVGQEQREVEDPAVTVAFKLVGECSDQLKQALELEGDLFALAWTTTPWTLPSNVCLVVGPKVDYVAVRVTPEEGEARSYVLAKSRVDAVFGASKKGKKKGPQVEVLAEMTANELVGLSYEPLFTFHGELDGPAHKVVAGDFVTTSDGTGIVHAAPAFGEDDSDVCQANGLAFVNLVHPDGTFTEACGPYAGKWVKDADKEIQRELKERGLLVKQERYKHNYPHCWRCKTPLLYYARSAWFIKTTAHKDDLVAHNQTITWAPEHIRDGRFGDFLVNNRDWCLSRERYWGTPLPVWECDRDPSGADGCEQMFVAGSVADLRERNPDIPADLDPHRPGVDEVTVPCACGGTMRRVKEVIDCWYDSGSMPFAQWGYPHLEGSKERFEANFPAGFISEAIDQTRGWFYTLHAIATLLFEGPAYRNCLVLGHVLDENGKKLSKHMKNYRPPDEVLDEHGADAMRWFFYANMTPGQGVRFSDGAVRDARRTFLIKLLNVYNFFEKYASSDGFDPRPGGTDRPPEAGREPLDRWVLAELNATVGRMREALDAYHYHQAATALEGFVDALSNWYVRRSRDRGWSRVTGDAGQDGPKWAFWWTLYDVLCTVSRLLAPFCPFLADELHRVLEREVLDGCAESVHLTDYPVPDERLLDAALSRRMELAQQAVNLGLAVRTEAKVKVRQALGQAVVLLSSPADEEHVHALADVVADELNVKAVEVSHDYDRYVTFDVRVDFRRLGPRFGKQLGAVRKALDAMDQKDLAAKARAGQPVELALGDGATAELGPDDLDVRLTARDGFAAAGSTSGAGGLVVVLDTTITPELRLDGLARELQSKIQGQRKTLDLPFDARVEVWVGVEGNGNSELARAIDAHREAILREVQADALHLTAPPEGASTQEVQVEAAQVTLGVKVVV